MNFDRRPIVTNALSYIISEIKRDNARNHRHSFDARVTRLTSEYVLTFSTKKLVSWLPDGEKSLMISLPSRHNTVVDRRIDGQTETDIFPQTSLLYRALHGENGCLSIDYEA